MSGGSFRILIWLLAWLGLLLGGAGCVAVAGRGGAALPAGPAVVVIAPAQPIAAELESEAYGDWAAYLNEFAAGDLGGVELVRMTPAEWGRAVRQPVLAGDYATVFLRGTGALVHRDKILEAQVYRAGKAWALGAAATDAASLGLVEAKLVRRP